MKSKVVFLRNDDVRNIIDDSLREIIELLILKKIPLSLAVEPANVSEEVVEFLLDTKAKYPNLIEIIQHGYNHQINYYLKTIGSRKRKGEFGGDRTYEQEYSTLLKGKKIMDNYFGDMWVPIITFPYGAFNKNTIKAVSNLQYLGISSSISFSFKSLVKDTLGRFLRKDILLTKRVSYHNSYRNNTMVLELDTSINFIKKYLDNNRAEHYGYGELIEKINFVKNKTDIIGILLHHRYHKDNINELEEFTDYLIKQDYNFSTLEALIYEKTRK